MEHQPLPAPPADISEGAWRWLDELAHASDYTGQAQQLWAGEILAALYPADASRQPPVEIAETGCETGASHPLAHTAAALRQAFEAGWRDGWGESSGWEPNTLSAEVTTTITEHFAAFLAQKETSK